MPRLFCAYRKSYVEGVVEGIDSSAAALPVEGLNN